MKICPACSREYGDEHESCLDDGVVLVRLDTGTNARAQDLIGRVVDGRYRVERIVGRGGMGTVYACRHVVVGKPFAMKVLRPGIERSEEILQRFIREAQAANAVQSRHICEMTDFGQLANGAFYVVMELLEGGSLTRALREQRLDRKALKHVFVQMAETLFKAHAANIIHRDLKPDNVMLIHDEGDPNFVKLVDFGIAKVMQSKASNLTETGVILGTPYYMSPEQARGDELDHRSDIYAMGVMMYRAFTGRLPFVADTAMGVLTRHLTEKPELPSRITEMDPALERLILRCLEKKPIDRFQTMADVADALRSLSDEVRLRDPVSTTVDERVISLPDLAPESNPTPTRLASPMAMSQKRDAWDGSRAEASSAPVPRSQPPPRPLSNPPTMPHIPAPVPPPQLPTPMGQPAQQQPRPLPYPHHLTPQAHAASLQAQQQSQYASQHAASQQAASQQAAAQHAASQHAASQHAASQQALSQHAGAASPYGAHTQSMQGMSSGAQPGSGVHAVHQPVSVEPALPHYMQGEAATNRGVSARISQLPTPRRWPIVFVGVTAVAVVALAIGAVALYGRSDSAPSSAASSKPTTEVRSDDGDEPAPIDEPVVAPSTAAPVTEPSTPQDAPSAVPSGDPAVHPRVSPRLPTPRKPGKPDGPVDPKPVDDVRDPFDD